MGWIVAVVALLFVVGMAMSVIPSPKEKALGRLRELAREHGFQMKLVPCPKWLPGPSGKKAQGMVPMYVLTQSFDAAALDQPVKALVADAAFLVVESAAPKLHGTAAPSWLLGVVLADKQASAYIKEPVVIDPKTQDQQYTEFLTQLKQTLHTCRQTV